MTQENASTQKERSFRLDAEHVFQFDCFPSISCFNQCCQDVTIVLTPYDTARLKGALGISSDQFLDNYALIIPKEKRLIPMVVLRMREEDKRCPFVTSKGCSVYSDRPWPCRMYPLDLNDDGTFRLIADPSRCRGLQEPGKSRVSDWLVDQGIPIYEEMNRLFSQLTIPLGSEEWDIDNPKIHQMIFMTLYNLDRFRGFVFESSFLDRFVVDPTTAEKIRRSDVELLKFGFDWIKFGIFGQKTLQVKPTGPVPKDP